VAAQYSARQYATTLGSRSRLEVRARWHGHVVDYVRHATIVAQALHEARVVAARRARVVVDVVNARFKLRLEGE
jgi:hypothetical protein